MPLSPDFMRLSILLCAIGMALLAAFFLRERRMSLSSYLGWGLLALLLPFLGPFLVILSCPGQPIRRRRRSPLARHNPVKLALSTLAESLSKGPVLRRAKEQLRKLLQSDS